MDLIFAFVKPGQQFSMTHDFQQINSVLLWVGVFQTVRIPRAQLQRHNRVNNRNLRNLVYNHNHHNRIHNSNLHNQDDDDVDVPRNRLQHVLAKRGMVGESIVRARLVAGRQSWGYFRGATTKMR